MRLDDPASIEAALSSLVEAFGTVPAFVNNAGTLAFADFCDLGLDDWRRVIDVDLTGSFVAGQIIARHMRARGLAGRIVNVSSVHEAIPLLGGAPTASLRPESACSRNAWRSTSRRTGSASTRSGRARRRRR